MGSQRYEPPPIKPTPGDLLMIFRTAMKELERLKAEKPDDFGQVWGAARATKEALDYWLKLCDQLDPSEAH